MVERYPTLVYTPSRLPGTPSPPPASCRPQHRWPEEPVTALEQGVTELTIRKAALTVAGVTITRFTVGQLFPGW